MKKLVIDNLEVKFRNSDENVMINESYKETNPYFRAAWVSLIVSDFEATPNEEQMKKNLLKVLSYLEMFNMNAIIFHVRTNNNAYYKTLLAPIDEHFGTYESFDKFDYLKWFIDECHNRNIEFHAWLNPYRIKSSGFSDDVTKEYVASLYKDYPFNPASNPKNILITNSKGAILNPCLDEVQDYIIDVCLELINNYDIDAIHFDDYFYAQMTPNIDVLMEDDQKDYEEFIKLNKTNYKKDNAEDKKNWRRDNVNRFIENLSKSIRGLNKALNKHVQLGISPTGIYSNGDGKVTYDKDGTAITNGSNTIGQDHLNSYLFCDSKKWVDNEWIDYIIPQSYWGFTHPTAGYADVMGWWNEVVKNKKVNLYSGMGVYMSQSSVNTYSWKNNPYEASDQVLYCNNLNNVKGTCIFSFRALVSSIEDPNSLAFKGLDRIRKEYWVNKVQAPKTMASK